MSFQSELEIINNMTEDQAKEALSDMMLVLYNTNFSNNEALDKIKEIYKKRIENNQI